MTMLRRHLSLDSAFLLSSVLLSLCFGRYTNFNFFMCSIHLLWLFFLTSNWGKITLVSCTLCIYLYSSFECIQSIFHKATFSNRKGFEWWVFAPLWNMEWWICFGIPFHAPKFNNYGEMRWENLSCQIEKHDLSN